MGEKKRNRLGTISLVVAVAGFLAVELQPWLALGSVALFGGLSLKGLLEAFFEASLAGAFADWFAVTALFKDPFGVHLPHTNILAKNKDSIADGIPRFLTGFVSPEAIREELGKIDYAAQAAAALSAGEAKDGLHGFLRQRAAEFLEAYSGSKEGEETARGAALRRFVDEVLGFVSDRVDLPTEAASILSWARKERFDERALEAIAEYARVEIGRNRVKLVAILTPMIKRNAGWQGLFIGSGTVERFVAGIQDELAELKADKTNDLRRFAISSLGGYAARLSSTDSKDAAIREEMAKAFRGALSDEGFRSGFASFLSQFLARAGEELSSADGRFIATLERLEASLAERLANDEELRTRLNSAAASLLSGVIERGRVIEGVTEYLAGLLRATDERRFVSRIEDSVWDDLQYIRLNGATVGGLVGLVIALAKAALAG
jgi:uncharacterized membrane-anchored protein YjiN (DUF445 family)